MAEFCYEYYLALELAAIREHAWYVGVMLKRPPTENEVGFDWVEVGFAQKYAGVYLKNRVFIEKYLAELEKKGDLREVLDKDIVHKLIGDWERPNLN